MSDITRRILQENTYLTLATISEDGSPWGTPVHFAYDESSVYWFSFDSSVHSQNIERDPRVFITIFDSHQNPGLAEERTAVYIKGTARKLEGDEEQYAQNVFADRIEDTRRLGEHAHFYAVVLGELNDTKSRGQQQYYGEHTE